MKLILTIALRNLFRQKRRNILLGIAIAFGIMILIIATAFSRSVSDIMFNKIVINMTGHLDVNMNEKGMGQTVIIRDRARVEKIIKETVTDVKEIREASAAFCRVIGNAKSDNIVLVGIEIDKELTPELQAEYDKQNSSFVMLEGEFTDLKKHDVENGVIVSLQKAKEMGIKKNDILKVRFKNINGQNQTGHLTVIGITKSDNIFMNAIMFTNIKNLRELMGYRPYESSGLQIIIREPKKNAIKMADLLHEKLKPQLALIDANIKSSKANTNATLLAFKSEKAYLDSLKNILKVTGNSDEIYTKSAVLISDFLANELKIKTGDTIFCTYQPKFDFSQVIEKLIITGIYSGKDRAILINERKFFDFYYDYLPLSTESTKGSFRPAKDNPLYNIFATEWLLLPRTADHAAVEKKIKDISKRKYQNSACDVRTMYETASQVLQLEVVLQMITLTAVFVLFLIILIGVINTLRMTIRERTREIGTIRAIGMFKRDVQLTFISETFFLTLFSSLFGTGLAFLAMHLISSIKISMEDNPLGMLLVDGRVQFLPLFSDILTNLLIVLLIAVATAYFPSRRAANLSAADALRHYE